MSVAVMSPAIPRRAEPHPLVFEEIRIENTNRCHYSCFFCPREKQTREQGFMSLEDLEVVLDRVGGHAGGVDLHGFGEPLLDRGLIQKVELVRSRWPEARPRIYSTLGVKVKPGYFRELVEAGLKSIEVSFYGFDRETYRQVHQADLYDLARENLIDLCAVRRALPESIEVVVRAFPSHPEVKQPGADAERIREFCLWLDSLGVTILRERDLHNYGSGREYNTVRDELPCSVAWGFRRRVLQVTWDLSVIPCCFDSNAEVKLGSLRSQTLAEIFRNDLYTRFIQSHLDDRLEDYPVCQACDRCHKA
ncbi:MAG TPA: radical SAM protein [Thermoanaerobaculia bacterium]|nr:radical SAM protein [Thermoanaerobaculia bacterium]